MIARMNALNDLTTEVRFRERMRGYDFEEVDSYVKTVSRATAQAAEQISELQQRLAQTESHSSDYEGVPETREMLLRTLVLAQRTADAAVSEARSEAKSITDFAQERAAKRVSEAEAAANERLRSSEERAVQTLAEAEENCQLILAEAKRTAAAELATERARKMEEIQALDATRAELEAATTAIQARLENERSQLRSLSVSFQSFVEQFEPVADAVEPGEETAWAYDLIEVAADAEAPEAGAGEPAAEPQALADADSPGESVLEFPPDPGDRPQAATEDPGDRPQAATEDPGDRPQAATEDPGDRPQAAKKTPAGPKRRKILSRTRWPRTRWPRPLCPIFPRSDGPKRPPTALRAAPRHPNRFPNPHGTRVAWSPGLAGAARSTGSRRACTPATSLRLWPRPPCIHATPTAPNSSMSRPRMTTSSSSNSAGSSAATPPCPTRTLLWPPSSTTMRALGAAVGSASGLDHRTRLNRCYNRESFV